MYDIADLKLAAAAKKRGITLVAVKRIEKPAHTKEFTMARSVDRAMLKAKVNMLYDLESLDPRRDHLHHRNSGLDTTLAKLCAAQGVLVGITLKNVRSLDPVLIGRVQQNILLCRKHKTPMAVFSEATTEAELPNESDLRSLLLVLGMSTAQATETLHNLEHFYTKHAQ